MQHAKPTYHLPPNFSTPPPPDGPFHLGTVLRDFDKREQMRPLNSDSAHRVPIPANEVYPDVKQGFEASRSRLDSGTLGLWARFLGLEVFGFGASAELSAGVERDKADVLTVDRVDTTYFYPSPDYLKRCCGGENGPVMEWLEAHNFRRPVFLVTGLKVARGLTLRSERGKKWTAFAEMGVQSPDGLLAEVGPKADGGVEKGGGFSFQGSSDVVVGIQCLKLSYKTKWHGMGPRSLQDKLYTKGAEFLDDEPQGQDDVISARGGFVVEDILETDFPQLDRTTNHDTSLGEEIWVAPPVDAAKGLMIN